MNKKYGVKIIYTVIFIITMGAGILSALFWKSYNIVDSILTNVEPIKYEILVDVEESKLYLFQNTKLVKTYKCSGGKWSTPSPIGTWRVTEKGNWGEGFGGSWIRTKCTMGKIWNTWNIR